MIARPRTFLLDENMPRKILTSLQREGFNATRVHEVGLRSQPDTAIFAYARAYHMTMITFDTDYLNQVAFPPPHAGMIVLRSLYVNIFPDPLDQGSAGKIPARSALPGKDYSLHTARPIRKDRSSLGSFPGLIDDWRVVASSTRYIRTRSPQELR
jgi:predicted nuclease of predicted toxin-antitoxin system